MTAKVDVRQLDPSQIDEAARILAEAFADESMFAFLLKKEHQTRVRALVHYFRATIRAMRPFGEVHAAMIGDELVGVAIRVPPGEYPVRMLRLPGILLRQLPGLLALIAICPGARRLLALGAKLEKGVPRGRPYWYLMHVAVRADQRRKGVATALASAVTRRADDEGVGCYLETSGEGTVALYLKHGFRIIDEATLFEGGPMGWRMWRDPAAAPS